MTTTTKPAHAAPSGATRPAAARGARAGALTITRPGLIEALTRVMATVPTKSTIPVLLGARVTTDAKQGTVTFQTTNLEQSTAVTVPAVRLGLDEAALALANLPPIVVPAKRLLDIAKALPAAGSLTLEIGAAHRLRVTGGKSKFEVSLLPLDEWPTAEPRDEERATFGLVGASFLAELDRAAPFLSTAESRPILNGALLEADGREVAVVGMDGTMLYRGVVAVAGDGPLPTGEWILPPAAIRALTSGGAVETVRLACTSQQVRAVLESAAGSVTVESRLIEGPYPNYRQVVRIPADRGAIVSRDAFLAALDQLAIALREEQKVKRVTADWTNSEVVLNATSDVAQADVVVPIAGTGMDSHRHAFDLDKIRTALRAMTTDEVRLAMSAPERAVFVLDAAAPPTDSLTTGGMFMPLRMLD